MTIKINLLPSGQRVGKSLQRVLRVTRTLGVISLGLFIVFILALSAIFVYSSVSLNNLNSANTGLKGRINGLETSETKIVLLKDRIGKIKLVQGIPTAIKNLDSINSVLTPLSFESTVNDLNVSSSKVSASVTFKSNSDISVFLENLSDSASFQTVSLSNFSFNPVSGYLVSITAVGK